MDANPLTHDRLRTLAEMLQASRPHELTCDEWLDHVAGYLESEIDGRPRLPTASLVEEHLALCPECREEYDALVQALRHETGERSGNSG